MESALTDIGKTTMPSGSELGRIIRERRQELGFSQQDLGEEVGVHRQYIYGIEKGKNPLSQPSSDALLKNIAKALDLDLQILLEARPSKRRSLPNQSREPDTLGALLTNARRSAGLTQTDVGKQIGVSTSVVSLIETGKKTAGLKVLQRLANVLDIRIPAELLSGLSTKDLLPDP